VALKVTGFPWFVGGNKKSATTALACTLTGWLAVVTAPFGKCTVRTAVGVPAEEYVWVAWTPVPVPPSPKAHVMDEAPVTPVAVNVTGLPVVTGLGKEKSAVGDVGLTETPRLAKTVAPALWSIT